MSHKTIKNRSLSGKPIKVEHLGAINEWMNATTKLLEAVK